MTPHELSVLLGRFSRPGVPKYTALRDAIVHAVASGRFAPGDRVPNEQELAGVLPISLGTIQRALRQLVDDGVVQRRQGHGSFITGRTDGAEMSHPFHCRFVDDSGAGYLKVFPEPTGRRVLKPPGEWSTALRAGQGLEITRRIRIGDEFTVFSSFVVDPQRLQVFQTLPLRRLNGENFKEVIFRATGRAIQKIDLFLRQSRPPAAVAGIIGLPARQLCLCLRATAFLADNDPVYYQEIFIPPTARELHIIADSRSEGLRG